MADEVALGHVVGVAVVHDRVHVLVVDDLGVLERVLELADAPLHMTLFVLRGVVAGVLLEIAFLTGTFDLLGHLDAAAGGEIVELRLQPVVGGAGQLLGRHRLRCHRDRWTGDGARESPRCTLRATRQV